MEAQVRTVHCWYTMMLFCYRHCHPKLCARQRSSAGCDEQWRHRCTQCTVVTPDKQAQPSVTSNGGTGVHSALLTGRDAVPLLPLLLLLKPLLSTQAEAQIQRPEFMFPMSPVLCA
eukprot:1155426-Pelagomonas_calceolata.AAC.1